MTTTDTPQPTTGTITLADAVQPLLDYLNKAYPSASDDYYVSCIGQFGTAEHPTNQVSIDLNIDEDTPVLNKRAVVTLLRKSGCNLMWTARLDDPTPEVNDPYKTPLRFQLARPLFCMECHWHWLTYLVIDHLEDDFDFEAAGRQIALLISYLDDELNLDELTPVAEAMFAAPPTKIVQDDDEKSPFRSEGNN